MIDQEMLTEFNALTLAEAFPPEHHDLAVLAGEVVARGLAQRQWSELFCGANGGRKSADPGKASLRFGRTTADPER